MEERKESESCLIATGVNIAASWLRKRGDSRPMGPQNSCKEGFQAKQDYCSLLTATYAQSYNVFAPLPSPTSPNGFAGSSTNLQIFHHP
jgi:hypothetical protein